MQCNYSINIKYLHEETQIIFLSYQITLFYRSNKILSNIRYPSHNIKFRSMLVLFLIFNYIQCYQITIYNIIYTAASK